MDGYRVLGGADHDAAALQTFARNFPSAKSLDSDLSAKSIGKELRRQLGGSKPDVVVGGPPCQGFSLTGPRNFDDPRNRLYLAVFDVVRELAPAAFVIENVRGMASLYGGQVRDENFLLLFNADGAPIDFTLPDFGRSRGWCVLLDTARPELPERHFCLPDGETVALEGRSMMVLVEDGIVE